MGNKLECDICGKICDTPNNIYKISLKRRTFHNTHINSCLNCYDDFMGRPKLEMIHRKSAHKMCDICNEGETQWNHYVLYENKCPMSMCVLCAIVNKAGPQNIKDFNITGRCIVCRTNEYPIGQMRHADRLDMCQRCWDNYKEAVIFNRKLRMALTTP